MDRQTSIVVGVTPLPSDDLRRCASTGNEYGVIEATVDGVKLKNLEQYSIPYSTHILFP
jgi:hypothetical protein